MSERSAGVAGYDLHGHTYWSYDATTAPLGYFETARRLGIGCLAITEHHNVDSQPEIEAIAAKFPEIRVIPAAELTVTTSVGGVDLLCYGLPTPQTVLSGEQAQAWSDLRARYHDWQRDWGQAIVRGMGALGYDYTEAQREALLRSYRPAQALEVQGLTHVKHEVRQRYFVERGFIATPGECDSLMGRVIEAGQAPEYPAVAEVVPVVKGVGGLVCIAHPAEAYFRGADRGRMDQLREECQLDGIECAHPRVPRELTAVYRGYCREHGLFSTGGTDIHRDADLDRWLGRHGGDNAWVEELLERLGRA